MVAGELPDLPHLVELPDRGVGADIIGRGIGMLVDLYAEVVPSGWRISRRPGRDVRRATDFLAWDSDAAEQHYAGAEWVKVQVCGPWTLAAMLELSSGHRALTDPGAVDDLATSLAEGLAAHVADIAGRLPGAGVVVQIDEPALPAVLAGSLSTASGFGTVRAVAAVRAIEVLSKVTDAMQGRPTIAHCCDSAAPLRLFRAAGFEALSFDMTTPPTAAAVLDPIGEAIETGAVLLAGVVPAARSGGLPTPLQTWAAPVLTVWDRLGFPRSQLSSVVVPTPNCGLAGTDREGAISAMTICRELAAALEDLPESW
jgi:methionine synthase II (cobalamin-independent)